MNTPIASPIVLPVTAATLLAGQASARTQRAFDSYVQRHLNTEDSAAGDREVREACADTFASTLHWLTSHVGMSVDAALRQIETLP